MFANRIVQVPTDEVLVDRSVRQRTDLTFDSVLDLACSIGKNQWIAPVLIDSDTNHIVAGERRLTAVRALAAAVNGDYSGFSKPDEAKEQLFPLCSCQVDSWKQWTRIPAQLGHDLTDQDLAVYEFVENAHRKDLTWQDKARAIYTIHAYGLQDDSDWNNTKTGVLTGLSHSQVAKNIRVWRMMEDEPTDDIKLIVQEAPTLNSAMQNLNRHTSRREDSIVTLTSVTVAPRPQEPAPTDIKAKPGPAPGVAPVTPVLDRDDDEDFYDEDPDVAILEEFPEEVPLGQQLLVNDDFNHFAASYTGEAFNFIHCDFPYGINFNKGAQTSGLESKLKGNYDDSPDVYWKLLDTLVEHRAKLIAQSAHVLFWFSQNLRRETEDFFAANFPDAVVQDFLLIWHCSDLDGTVPDPQRFGRRTYETAFLLTFGDRYIVAPKALSFAAPRESRTRIHRSQKPVAVLSHFLSMFVDDATTFLDPTVGSGTSCLVAHNLGAKRILGIEKEKETYSKAVSFINASSSISL